MAGAQFEYDERGGTFFYFIISFYALVLIPATYYLWPSKSKKDGDSEHKRCHCEGCEAKEQHKKLKQPWSVWKKRIIKFCLILAWIGFVLLAYKVANIENDHVEYDPFVILEIDKDASDAEIKKAYRTMSLLHHPDKKTGDPKKFMLISKAYQALTNPESKKNWIEYGNPDGPGATQFGIALPKWLVSKEYGSFVLFGYIFLFMIVLPVGVGIWWYNSIKYSVDQVLMDTTHLYGYMFNKTPHMILRRILMVLGGSFEFAKPYNPEIVERPSDDKEVPVLIKNLENLGEKNKERPLCYPYSLKSRALIYAHLSRMSLPPDTLNRDREYVLKKCPILVQEMVQIVSQLVVLASAGRVPRMPSLDTIENVMRVQPMLIQAMWDKQSPLLQLPHFTEDMLRHCVTKKRRIKTTADLASLEEEERRALFRSLSTDQYEDIRTVLASLPSISLDFETEVQGEDDKDQISAGSLVTVKVRLTRKSLLDWVDTREHPDMDDEEEPDEEEDEASQNGELPSGEPVTQQNQTVKQRKPWEKNKKKQKKPGGNKNKKPAHKPAAAQPTQKVAEATTPEISKETKRKRKERDPDNSADEDSGSEMSEDSDVRDALDEIRKPGTDDEDAMEFDDELIRKERILETKSKITHSVHCPHFPDEKYEWWWVYLCDRKRKLLISGPVSCTSLLTEEEVELKFQAPGKPGSYAFQVCVKSDSYVDADQTKDIKISVSEKREVKSHPQWDFSSDEEEKKSESDHSDGSEYTEGEEDDD